MTKVLGVKEAMQHFVSTLDGVETPATTIKKLTKQALDPNSENEYIQKARTIAEIWEEAAIGHGYVPDEGELRYKYKKDYTLEITEASPDGVYFAKIDGDVFTDGTIGLVYEGKTYNLSVSMTLSGQVNRYGDFENDDSIGKPTFENCPIALISVLNDNLTNVLVQEAGTYTFSILYGGDEGISFNPPGGTVVSDPTNPITPGKPV